MGTHLTVLSKSYPMNTNMTGFRWFSKIFASLCFGSKAASAFKGLTTENMNCTYSFHFHEVIVEFCSFGATYLLAHVLQEKKYKAVRKGRRMHSWINIKKKEKHTCSENKITFFLLTSVPIQIYSLLYQGLSRVLGFMH